MQKFLMALVMSATLAALSGCESWAHQVGGSESNATNAVATNDASSIDAGTSGTDVSCVPNCNQKDCGDDGCGGTCGTCGDDVPYCVAGACQAATPKPTADTASSADAGSSGSPDTDVSSPPKFDCGNLKCNDGNICTDDFCDPNQGCMHTANTAACGYAGDACTGADKCSNGSCIAGAKKSCDDNDPCTTDSCKSDGGCWHLPLNCDDGNTNTVDTCVNGACVHTEVTPPQQWSSAKVCITVKDPTIVGVVGDEWTSSQDSYNWGSFEKVSVTSSDTTWCRVVTDPTVKAVGFLLEDENTEMYPGWHASKSNIIFSSSADVESISSAGVVFDQETVTMASVKSWFCPGNNPLSTADYGICFWSGGIGVYRMMVPLYPTVFGWD